MKKYASPLIAALLLLVTFNIDALAQRKKGKKAEKDQVEDPLKGVSLGSMAFRSIGPALTSGRIADIAVNPDNSNEFYVAAAAGGVWKTTNAGTTFEPIFENYGSYSIGSLAMDPNNHSVLWVGTGENNNQRSVSYGDGVYKSVDGGASFKKVGLDNSEHIGMIKVDPRNSDVVYVLQLARFGMLEGTEASTKQQMAVRTGRRYWKLVSTLVLMKFT